MPPERRTQVRLSEAGGNVDRERFFKEILYPLTQGTSVSYRPFSCQSGRLGTITEIPFHPITIVEGCYALHPKLRNYYHLRIFLSAPLILRESRLLLRNGPEGLMQFQNKWIPLENHYFISCQVEQCSDISLWQLHK